MPFYIFIIGISKFFELNNVLHWKWVPIFVTVLSAPSSVVTIYTTSLTFTNSTFCPQSAFMCFVWISEQTAIISLYSINWLVCVTETECVYCAVRTGCLNISQFKFYWNIRGSLCSIPGCGERSGSGTVFLRILRFSTVSIILPLLHTYLGLHAALTRTRLWTFQNSIRGVFKKRPNFLNSTPTSSESALRPATEHTQRQVLSANCHLSRFAMSITSRFRSVAERHRSVKFSHV